MPTPPLHLVACVAQKGAQAAPAAELYRSDWFCKARAYVEALGAPWRILSAQHGLVDPAAVLEPYNASLLDLAPVQRLAWGEQVALDLHDLVPRGGSVVFLAGKVYREAVTSSPCFNGWHAAAPMQGLGIGEQKAWLIRHTRGQLMLL